MSEDMQLPEVFTKAVELGLARGYHDIDKIEGALVLTVDDNWVLAMNGHREPVDVPAEDGSMGCTALPSLSIAIFWNGWLGGIVGAGGGGMFAGAAANEDTLCEALTTAIEAEEIKKGGIN